MALSRGEYRLVGRQIQRQRAISPGVPSGPRTNSNQAMRNASRGRKLSPGEMLTPARDERPIQAITGETTSLRTKWR